MSTLALYEKELESNDIKPILSKNPSLKAKLSNIVPDIYENAMLMAAEETQLDETDFPTHCEWEVAQILAPTFFPNL